MSWIWLDSKNNPDFQKNFYNVNTASQAQRETVHYAVACFMKRFTFDREIVRIKFRISADSIYHLFINGTFSGIGPASPGGDFLCSGEYPHHFADVFSIETQGREFEITADVKLLSEVLTEYSKGHGGFFCELEFIDESGESHSFATDESWNAVLRTEYCAPECFDSSLAGKKIEKAQVIDDIWHLRDSEIPPVSLNTVFEKEYTVEAKGKTTEKIELDMIYGVIPFAVSSGRCRAALTLTELEGQDTSAESICFGKAGEYISFRMHSAGEAVLELENTEEEPVSFTLRFIAPWYPVEFEAGFICSDEELNLALDVCRHTLMICRQSVHLDSTKHQEHLACTGDYNIESLITPFCFNDMRLAVSDVKKTADWIVANDGRMFHTTYSLIWVQMLKNVYMFTGDITLLTYCRQAMETLFSLFETYFGTSGVIETPPDYMFVDWTVIDGYSMHHPPKALGQTVLNAFWYEAVKCAADIYNYLGESAKATEFESKAKDFKIAFNREFFDAEKGLYFDGKADYHPSSGGWLPENPNKRYYSKYPDILACAYGLADDPCGLLSRVIFNDDMQDIQPYFTHYLLDAVRRNGLENEYAMRIFDRWKPVVRECSKGLAEGWIAPQPDYKFDHSHAWGGTIAYQLPAIVSGLEILEPGMKKISLCPNSLGMDFVCMSFFTPYGPVYVSSENGIVTVNASDKIEVIYK